MVVSLLNGCVWRLSPDPKDQDEKLYVKCKTELGTCRADAISSSSRERFTGKVVWEKDSGTSPKYRGTLTGYRGRTLTVEGECDPVTSKCTGSARTNLDEVFTF